MNNRRHSLLLLLLLSPACLAAKPLTAPASAPSLASAQARSVLLSQQLTQLTLGDAVYLGLRNNRGIRSAYLQRVAQKFDLRVSEDAFNPKLLINGSYLSNQGSDDRGRDARLSPTTSLLGQYGTRLSMAWTQELSRADRAGRYRSDGLDLAIIQPLLRGAGWDVTTAPLRLARITEQGQPP